MIFLGIAVWYAIGVWGHVYWLTNKYDYTTSDISTSLFSGIVGPLSFWIGWSVYGPVKVKSDPKILLHKRC